MIYAKPAVLVTAAASAAIQSIYHLKGNYFFGEIAEQRFSDGAYQADE
jgi:hypothetical protein